LTLEAATGLPFAALLLAFAPGGLAEMSLISLSLGIDAAFVSTHQVVRIFFIVALFPLAFRFLAGPPGQR
ncbi:MAG: AbrB family transcriptional regulator, partial [Verrucomicrobia bacterium]|nr:AbrB family transcriptional regulator [Verrucomicrobiota bacterium]